MTGNDLTVVILTKDEAPRLPRCLAAIPDYPVLVVDCGSTDGTPRIAAERGARVVHRAWKGFAGQRNLALRDCQIDTQWVLFVDADEVYPASFYEWFETEARHEESVDGYMVPSFLYLRGRRLARAPGYPIYHPRLVRRARALYVTNHTGHGESLGAECRVRLAKIPYEHHFYDGELIAWMHKHVDKAAFEVKRQPTPGAHMTWRGRISVALGGSFLRVPGRFLYHYLLRGGIVDGRAGLEFSLMFAWYEATIYLQGRFQPADAPAGTKDDNGVAVWTKT
jgi:glycosyltransferase involved in cell wall biosynthesis